MNRQQLTELEQDMREIKLKAESKLFTNPVKGLDTEESKDLFFPELPFEVKALFKVKQNLQALSQELENYLFYSQYGFKERVEREKFDYEISKDAQALDLLDTLTSIIHSIKIIQAEIKELKEKYNV